MNSDADIKRRRAELEQEEKRVIQEWKDYDARHPVVVGAYKPDDYDAKQRYFVDQLTQVRSRLRALPPTRSENLTRMARMGATLPWESVYCGC